MKLMLIMALILNLVILGCELYALGHIKGKLNILKYYTYLQNFLSLIISFVCSVYPFYHLFPHFFRVVRARGRDGRVSL